MLFYMFGVVGFKLIETENGLYRDHLRIAYYYYILALGLHTITGNFGKCYIIPINNTYIYINLKYVGWHWLFCLASPCF